MRTKISKGAIELLDLVLARIHAMADPSEDGQACLLSSEVKREVQEYVADYIEPELYALLRYTAGAGPIPAHMLDQLSVKRTSYPTGKRSLTEIRRNQKRS